MGEKPVISIADMHEGEEPFIGIADGRSDIAARTRWRAS
jgi:hypothetical protein